MHTINITLREDNLAEVLAGIAILGISETHYSNSNFCRWNRGTLIIEAAITEYELLQHVHEFISDLQWVQSLGDVHQGVFQSKNMIGVSPFMDFANHGEPSIFKNFSGQVTALAIATGQQRAIAGLCPSTFAGWLAETALKGTLKPPVNSWGLAWRTNAHSLDVGFSPNDDNTSRHNKIFPVVDALANAALSFFLPCAVLKNGEHELCYNLWTELIPISAASLALTDGINGLAGHRYKITRRPKAYGDGESYKYFPAAIIQNQH